MPVPPCLSQDSEQETAEPRPAGSSPGRKGGRPSPSRGSANQPARVVGLTHGYTFRKSVAERRQEAKSVIRGKRKKKVVFQCDSDNSPRSKDNHGTCASHPGRTVLSVSRARDVVILSASLPSVGGQRKQNPVSG